MFSQLVFFQLGLVGTDWSGLIDLSLCTSVFQINHLEIMLLLSQKLRCINSGLYSIGPKRKYKRCANWKKKNTFTKRYSPRFGYNIAIYKIYCSFWTGNTKMFLWFCEMWFFFSIAHDTMSIGLSHHFLFTKVDNGSEWEKKHAYILSVLERNNYNGAQFRL